MATADIVERLANIDVRAPREFSHTVPEWAKENGITEFSSATTPSTMPNLVRG